MCCLCWKYLAEINQLLSCLPAHTGVVGSISSARHQKLILGFDISIKAKVHCRQEAKSQIFGVGHLSADQSPAAWWEFLHQPCSKLTHPDGSLTAGKMNGNAVMWKESIFQGNYEKLWKSVASIFWHHNWNLIRGLAGQSHHRLGSSRMTVSITPRLLLLKLENFYQGVKKYSYISIETVT